MKAKKIPKPGSDAAAKRGCTCPVLDNHHGQGSGFLDDEGSPAFWITQDCPVHATPARLKDDDVDLPDIDSALTHNPTHGGYPNAY